MRRMAWCVAAVVGGLLAVGVIVAPDGRDAWLRLALLLVVASAMTGGLLMWRQARMLPWWLLIGSVVAFAGASALRLGVPEAGPALRFAIDGIVLAGYIGLAAAALGLARRLDPGGDREGVLDGAIVALAVGVILAVLLFQPTLLAGGGPSRVHLFVGPIVFAAIAGIITRFALLMPRRCLSAWLLVGGAAGGLGGNLLRTAEVATGAGFHTGSLADGLLLAGYVMLAVAALHPSMVMLAHPVPAGAPVRTRMRLILLGAALLIPPALVAFEPPDLGRHMAAVAAALVNVLVLWRLARLFHERERITTALLAQSRRDPLTGLANRLHIDEVLPGMLARAKRDERPLGVLFCDLDRFKRVNDRYGHAFGDQVLVEVAHRMRQTVRAGETLARLSGDEFVVLAEGLDEFGARQLARRLEQVVTAPIELDGRQVSIGVSIGVSVSGEPSTPADLLGEADLAMYEDKRNRVIAVDL